MSLSRWLQPTQKIIWVIFLVTLPVTSFPYFPSGLGGSTLVRPLALYPLVILLLISVIPVIFTLPISRTVLPLFGFVLVALASSALAFLRGVDPVLGVTVMDRVPPHIDFTGSGGCFLFSGGGDPSKLKRFAVHFARVVCWVLYRFAVGFFTSDLRDKVQYQLFPIAQATAALYFHSQAFPNANFWNDL